MRKKTKATSLKIQEKVPPIRNIANIKGRIRRDTLLHFSAKQWKAMIAKIPKGKRMPKYGICLEGYPIPGGDVLVRPVCIEGPCEICRVLVSGLGEGGMPIYECQCIPDRERCFEEIPPQSPTSVCALAFRRTGGLIHLRCESRGCRGRCRLTSTRDRESGRIMIACQCSR